MRTAASRSGRTSRGIREEVKRVAGPPSEMAAMTRPSWRRTGAPRATYPSSSSLIGGGIALPGHPRELGRQPRRGPDGGGREPGQTATGLLDQAARDARAPPPGRPRAAPCRWTRRAPASGCRRSARCRCRWPPRTSSRISVMAPARISTLDVSPVSRVSASSSGRAAERIGWRAGRGRRARWRRARGDTAGRLAPDHELGLLERAEQPEGRGLAEGELPGELRERPLGAGIREGAHDAQGARTTDCVPAETRETTLWNGVSRSTAMFAARRWHCQGRHAGRVDVSRAGS